MRNYSGRLDRRIISHLRVDGRAWLWKLTLVLDVARGTIQNRLDRPLETGTLLEFTVRVREDYEDYSVRAVMLIEVIGLLTARVIERLGGIAEIRTLHITKGNWDLVADIHVSKNGVRSKHARASADAFGIVTARRPLCATEQRFCQRGAGRSRHRHQPQWRSTDRPDELAASMRDLVANGAADLLLLPPFAKLASGCPIAAKFGRPLATISTGTALSHIQPVRITAYNWYVAVKARLLDLVREVLEAVAGAVDEPMIYFGSCANHAILPVMDRLEH